jgi:hypothetical protein
MSDLQPSESSPTPVVVPPPLPHKVLFFKLGWRLGFWFGIVQAVCFLLLFSLYFFSPGGPPPLMMFVATAGAVLQAFSAHFISKHKNGARGLFTIAIVCVSFFYLIIGGFIFGVLNLVPLLLLVLSSSPDVAPKAQESGPLETSGVASSTESSSPKEDLY